MNDKIFNKNYWDCECENDWIHPVSQKSCNICNAVGDDQPPARQDEVYIFGFEKDFPQKNI